LGDCFLLGSFFQNYRSCTNSWANILNHVLVLTKFVLGHILGDFFRNSSGHPAGNIKVDYAEENVSWQDD
jgi:hypothetical protein